MRFQLFLFPIFILLATGVYSQDDEANGIQDITRASFLNPGISYEKRIAKFQSIYLQGFFSLSGSIGSGASGNNAQFQFDPAFGVQYRYYYNAFSRQAKGKRTDMNNMNYISGIYTNVFSKKNVSTSYYTEDKPRAVNTLGIVWGLQRNYKKRFSLDFNIGLGYLFTKSTHYGFMVQPVSENTTQFTGAGQLSLGFWLNKQPS